MVRSHTSSHTRRRGFSMIELLVVATIMIVITAMGIVSYTQVNRNARNSKRKADLETVRQALVLYRTQNGAYPTSANYAAMLTALSSGSFINSTGIQDPQSPTQTYRYSQAGSGATFSLCADLEPDGADHCVTNP